MNNHFNARALWAAISDSYGVLEIPRIDYLRLSSFGSLELAPTFRHEQIGQPPEYSAGKGDQVRMLSLDSLNLVRLDLLKIYVEWMEEKVVRGAAVTIAKFHPAIFVKSDHDAIVRMLQSAGYRLIVVGWNILALHKEDSVSKLVSATEPAWLTFARGPNIDARSHPSFGTVVLRPERNDKSVCGREPASRLSSCRLSAQRGEVPASDLNTRAGSIRTCTARRRRDNARSARKFRSD